MSTAPFQHPLRNWTGPWTLTALVALAVLGLFAYRPPPPQPTTAPDTTFAAARALRLVDSLASAPRPVGSVAHDSVRAFLLTRLRGLGLQVDTQTAEVVQREGGATWAVRARNILGRLPGRDPTGSVLLVAHYDGVLRAPAAADDGSGVATIVETLRALRATGPLRNDIVVLLSDGEELGLAGARAFAAAPWPERPSVVLNFDARGDAGPSLMFETGPSSGPLVRHFAETPLPLASSLFQEIYRRMPNSTDLSVFIAMGLPGLNFANGERGALYHTPLDAPANLSSRTVQHDGDHALALAKALGHADLSTAARGGPDPVYFYVPGLGLLHYAVGWVVPLALLFVALLVGVAVDGARRGRVRTDGFLVGFVVALLATGVAAALGAGLWVVVRGAHPEWGTLIGAALYREGPYAAAVVALGVGVVFGFFLLVRRWFAAPSLALGALLLPAAVAVFMAFAMPWGSHVFLWPTVFGLAMLAVLIRRPGSSDAPATAGFMLVLAPGVLLLMAPLVWLVWVFLSITAAAVIGALAAVTALLLLPFLDAFGRPVRWWFPAFAVLLAGVLVAIGLTGDRSDAERPLADQLFYVVDRDSGRAWWATADPATDPWSGRFVGAGAEHMQLSRLSLLASYPGRAQPAPAVDRPGAQTTVLEDRQSDGRRIVTLQVAWPAGTMLGVVAPRGPVRLLGVAGLDDSVEGRGKRPVEGRTPPAGSGWRVERWDADVPITLTLSVAADSSVSLRLAGYRQGLPELPNAPSLGRPADRMAAPRRITDVTIVREFRVF
ncbi:MAG: M20/M25/M40 family metallo-hydrolase [Gemmatimonadota bacterium]|jgi:hypothetical protein